MKRLLLCISAGAISALFLIQLYNLFIHPEINFYKKADAITTLHEQNQRSQGNSCYIIAGGSEAKTCLIPSVMQAEAGIAVVNAATAAGFGLETNAAIGMHHMQSGDTMLLSLISCDERNINPTTNGIKLAIHLLGFDAFQHGIIPLSPGVLLPLLSSEANSMIAGAVRKLSRGYSFVYDKESTLHPDGWMEVHRHTMKNAPSPSFVPNDLLIGPKCRDLLLRTQKACKQINAGFIVFIPISYSNYYAVKRSLMHALQITRMGIPVLKDERLGLTTNNNILADTYCHFNAEGADWHSRIIAQLLKKKSYWTEQELLVEIDKMGFKEDTTPQLPASIHHTTRCP